MNIFRINKSHAGQEFIVRPLLNYKDLSNNILCYKTRLEHFGWNYRFLCFALVNDEFKIFEFNKYFKNLLFDSESKIPNLFLLNNNKAIKIKALLRHDFLCFEYSVIEDEKFKIDSTPEKREDFLNLLHTTDLDLQKALEHQKSLIQDRVIKFPDYGNGSKEMTLKEIYEQEEPEIDFDSEL